MGRSKEKTESQNRGFSIKTILIPVIILFIILHGIIIYTIVSINSSTSLLSSTMQKTGQYTGVATSMLAGASQMSQTSSFYVMQVVPEGGRPNLQPLGGFAQEQTMDRRGDDVLAQFEHFDVSPEVLEKIRTAAEYANRMMNNELQAIALSNSVYPIPDTEPFNLIPLPELSQEDLALSAEERLDKARSLVGGPEAFENMRVLSENVNQAVGEMQGASGQMSAEISRTIAMQRSTLWAVTISIIILLALTFVLMIRVMIDPLVKFGRLIDGNQMLDENRGVREVRHLAHSYNELMERRDALDGILRSAAETDALTGLPNRYSFDRYLLDLDKRGYSIGILLFDVNFLKETNDTKGHAAGDELIRKSAKCIRNCFGSVDERNCFRMGGDEFAAIVKDISLETLMQFVSKFQREQKELGISIACGYGYAEDVGTTTFRKLMDRADGEMYKQKKVAHGLHITAG